MYARPKYLRFIAHIKVSNVSKFNYRKARSCSFNVFCLRKHERASEIVNWFRYITSMYHFSLLIILCHKTYISYLIFTLSNYKIYSIQYEMSLLYQIRCQAIHSSTDKCFIISLEYVLYHYRYFYRKAYQCCKVHYTYVNGQANIGFFRNVSFVKGLQTILEIHSLHLVTA